ncbi:hypothetical protein LMA04_01575 [Pseudescherichia vulneris]|uniref:hypothetical protein n=1 Tax=Pseudescherichia vulneris TaxID=566 RepID=UPI00227A53E9|nr:hypothetical protein [Pseudescherichia vulneris]WAH52776.1 hypothetical protein LMA04_01575 [Pseudescherichia vulneris]
MHSDLERVLIIGNSGSGKSWLARQLAEKIALPVTDLDNLNWEPGGYVKARAKEAVLKAALTIASEAHWIMEGVYGWIADSVATYATHIIWLTPAPAECVENIKARGVRNNGSAADFAALLEWAAMYETRAGSSSYQGHLAVFAKASTAQQIRLSSRDEMNQFLSLY